MQLRKFIANMLCLFIPNKKIRHKLRDSFCRPRVGKQKYIKIKQQWKQHGNGEKLLPARFEKYDLVFGIGATCHVRRYLDIFKLAQFTTPLDWTGSLPPQNFSQSFDLYRDTKFKEKIDWSELSALGQKSVVTFENLERFEAYWDWKELSRNFNVDWNIELLERFIDKWNWSNLDDNLAFFMLSERSYNLFNDEFFEKVKKYV